MDREAVWPGGGHGVGGPMKGGWTKLQAQDHEQAEKRASRGEQISPGSAVNAPVGASNVRAGLVDF